MSRGSNYPEGGTPASSQIIWLEQRVKELERELEIVTKERTHWFKKSQGVKCDDEALLCEIYNGEKDE